MRGIHQRSAAMQPCRDAGEFCQFAGLSRSLAASIICQKISVRWSPVAIMMAGVLSALIGAGEARAQMALPGSFELSDTGAANYTIPIAVPPGTAGMQPSLSLNYSSQSGNGLLGIGWSLSGLPTVTRCPKTIAQDGAVGGINYDANDRFCLEGQRLVAISGAYGADQTEYRTERESFSKIVSYGTAGTGPAWFKAWSKSGQVMEFGNTADSRIEAQGKTTARLWAANKISDTKGNYISVTYTEDSANGDYRPSSVDYTGNASASVAPFASVRFTYATRPDITPLYDAGSLVKTMQRLTNVKTYVGETLVQEHQFAYDTSPATQKSRITSISLCGATGTCLPATTVAWSGAAGTAFSSRYDTYENGWNFDVPGSFIPISGDFNGDGRTDYLLTAGTQRYVFLSNGDGTFSSTGSVYENGWNFGIPSSFMSIAGDFNGDGKPDYLLTAGTQRYVFFSNGDGTFSSAGSTYENGWNFDVPSSFLPISGDFNGDGRTDYLLTAGTQRYVFLSNGDGAFSSTGSVYENGWDFGIPSSFMPIVDDFNGDGRVDYLLTVGTQRYMFLSNGDGTFSSTGSVYENGWNFGIPSSFMSIAGDFNGDGKPDYLLTAGTQRYVFTATGPIPDQLLSITSGLDSLASFSYKPLVNGSIYTKGSGSVYPVIDLQAPLYVVSEIQASDGIGGNYRSTYKYAGARSHVQGRGFLGFQSVMAKDEQTLVEQLTTYLQPYPYTGLVASRVKKLGATTLNETVNTYAQTALGGTRSFVYLTQSVEKSWELNGSLVSQVTTTHEYDSYGNATQVSVSTPDGYSKTTTNTYTNDTLNWLLGRLTRASVTSVTP